MMFSDKSRLEPGIWQCQASVSGERMAQTSSTQSSQDDDVILSVPTASAGIL
jgi:hypothetical protein